MLKWEQLRTSEPKIRKLVTSFWNAIFSILETVTKRGIQFIQCIQLKDMYQSEIWYLIDVIKHVKIEFFYIFMTKIPIKLTCSLHSYFELRDFVICKTAVCILSEHAVISGMYLSSFTPWTSLGYLTT